MFERAIGLIGATGFYQAAFWALAGGVIRNKLVADGLGVEVSGAFGGLSSVTALFAAFAFFGMWTVGVRDISLELSKPVSQRPRTLLIIVIVGVASLIAVVVTAVSARDLARLVAAEPAGANAWTLSLIVVLAAGHSLAAIYWRACASSVTSSITTFAGNAISIAIVGIAVHTGQPTILALGLAASFGVPAAVWAVLHFLPLVRSGIFRAGLPGPPLRNLLAGGSASLLGIATRSGGDIIVRGLLVTAGGASLAGLAQPLFLLGATLIPQFTSIGFSRYSAGLVGRDDGESRALGRRYFVEVLALLSIVAFAAPLLVPLLFSAQFEKVVPAFSLYAAAELLRWTGTFAAVQVTALGRPRWVYYSLLVGFTARVGLVCVALPVIGLYAIPLSIAVEALVVYSLMIHPMRTAAGTGTRRLFHLTMLSGLVFSAVIGGYVYVF